MVSLFLAPAFASRGTIEHYSATRVAEQTQTGTSTNWTAVTGTANSGTTASTNGWIDSSNLTAGEDYLVMVWGEHSTNNTAGRSGIRVVRGTTPTVFTESQAIEETDNSGAAFKTPYFWFTVWTAVADEDLEVQFYNDLNTHTAAVEDVTLVVMNAEDLVANSELIYDIDTGGGTNSTTFTMRSSITWTPATANDTWWVGGYIKHDQMGTADQAEGRFDLNAGTIRALHSIEGEDANDTPLYGMGWAQQFAASSQTIEVETREDAAVSGGSEWDATGIFALRLNGFETFKAYGVAGDGTALTANNTYVEQGNVDHQMLSVGNYLVAAGAVVDDNGGVVNSKLTLADTDITDPTGGYSHNNTDTIPTTLGDMQIDSTLGLKDLDFDAQRTSATQAELQDRWVVAFSMERAGPPAELSMDGYIFENDDGTTTGFMLGGGEEIEECGSSEPQTITATHLTTGTSGTNGTSVNTASISPSADKLILASVIHGIEDAASNPTTPTLSGNGLTWVMVHTAVDPDDNDARLTVFRAMGASPSSGAVTISTGSETQHAWGWSISEFDNVDTSGTNGSGAIVQSDDIYADTTTGLTVNLAAFEIAGNATYGAFGLHGDTAVTPGSGFTELGEDGVTDAERDLAIQSEWRNDADTSVDASWAADDGYAIGIEIRASTVAADGTLDLVPLASGDDGTIIDDLNFFDNSTDYSAFGMNWESDNETEHAFIRFPSATIPQGATITSAYLELEADADVGESGPGWPISSTIAAVDTDNYSSAPANYSAGNTERTTSLTTSQVDWDFNNAESTTLNSPSIVSVVQEVIDRGGWTSGNGIGIWISDDGTVPDTGNDQALQTFETFDGSVDPVLHIEYSGSGCGIIANELTSGTDTTAGTTATTASISPSSDTLILATVATSFNDSEPTTLTGNGLTWVQIGEVAPSGSQRLTLFRAMGSSPSSGTVTLDTGADSQNFFSWSITEYFGVDTSGTNGSGAVVQIDDVDTTVGATSATVTLASFGDSTNNAAYATFWVGNDAVNITEEGGYTELHEHSIDTTSDASHNSQWMVGEDTSPSATWTGSNRGFGIALEIKAAGAASNPTPTLLTSGSGAGTSVNTASITPTADNLILATVATARDGVGSGGTTPTLSGNGLTWVQIESMVSTDDGRLTLFRAMGASPSAGQVTISTGATTNDMAWTITEFNDVDTSGTNGSGAVVQSAIDDGSAGSLTVTLGSFENGANPTYGSFYLEGDNGANDITAGSGFTELGEVDYTAGSQDIALNAQWRSDSDTSVDASFSFSTENVGVAVEIRPEDIGAVANGDDFGAIEGGTQLAGSEFSSGQIPTGVRHGERMNLRVHLTNSGGSIQSIDELALFYDRGDGIWSKVKRQQPPLTTSGGGCDDTAWTCETVASTNDAGRYNSLAIDRLGHPWVSYRDETSTELKVARYVGSEGSGCALASWSCQTIDSGTDSGEHTSIAIGNGSDVWISYWDDNSDDLRVANFVNAGGNCDDLYSGSDAWNCTIIDSTGSVGEYNSISIDRFGNPWVSYYDATNTRLKVAEYVGGTSGSGCASTAWTCTNVENNGVEGQYSSIAFDEDGRPWVSYYHSSSTELKVARFVNGGGSGCASTSWTCWVVDSDNTSGEYSSIGFSPNGTAYVAYYNQTGANLRVAQYAGSGGDCDSLYSGNDAWECTEVDSSNSVGSNASLAFDPAGAAWVAYRDATNNTLRLARYVGSGGSGCATSTWNCSAVESVTSAATGRSSLAFDRNGLPWIAHFDETNDNLLLAYLNSRAGEILSASGQYLVNKSSIVASRADMTSVSDSSNGNSPDCIATANWNNGRYFEHENGSGLSLPNGLGADQCTEIMWTLDMSQASPNTTYRFIVATNDNFEPDHGMWRGPAVINEYPTIITDPAEASVYRYAKDNLLEMANCNTDTAWGCGVLDATDGGAEYTSTGFDQGGNPWISYYEPTGGDLKVARYVNSGGAGCADPAWHCEVLDSTNDTGLYTSLAFDQNGSAWISYYDTTNDDLKVARYVGQDGTGCDSPAWECKIIDSTGNTGQYTSLAFDASGSAWITYYDVSNSDLDVTRYVGTAGTGCDDIAWTCSTIESEDDIGSYSSLAFDAKGKPWVSYYDATADDLKVARYTGLGDSSTCGTGGGASGPPTVQTRQTSSDASGATRTVTLPSGIQAGDLIVIILGDNDGNASSWSAGSSGFTVLAELDNNNDVSTAVAYKLATGSEGSSVDLSMSGAVTSLHSAYRISGAEDPGTQAPQATTAIGTSSTPNPPSITPAGAPKDFLYLVGATMENASAVNSFPTNYTTNGQSIADGANQVLGSGERQTTASSSEDPGTFTFSSNDNWVSITVAIHPGSGGSGGGESNWDCVTVDATDDVGQYSSIAMDGSGNPWISYYDNTGGNLEVANFTGGSADCDSVGGGSDDWECTTVDSTDNVGRYTSIGFDAAGMAWVSYLDFTNTDLNAARYLGGSSGDCNSTAWDCMDISSSAGGNNAHGAIAFDLSGTPWISHEGTSTNSLNLAIMHLPPTKPTADIVIPFATRSALNGDSRYRLTPGVSPYTNPYGTCGGSSDNHGYCGLYHPEGYRDSLVAESSERPIYTLATRFSSNSELPTALAVFQSSVAPNTENVILQVYRFGTTNAWETVSTYNSAGCTSATCTIRALPSGTPSDYYETDGSDYWVHFRIYQTETDSELDFQLDHFTAEQTAKFLRGGRVFRENITDPLGW